MTVASEVKASPAAMSEGEEQRMAGQRLRPAFTALGALALLAALAPTLLGGTVIALGRPDALLDGDQAIDGLAVMRSTHLGQLASNYSRFGWNHPGNHREGSG